MNSFPVYPAYANHIMKIQETERPALKCLKYIVYCLIILLSYYLINKFLAFTARIFFEAL